VSRGINQHANAKTYLPAGLAVPPSSLLGVKSLAVYPLLELRTGHRKTGGGEKHPCMHPTTKGVACKSKQPQKEPGQFAQTPRVSREIAPTWRSLHVDPVGALGDSVHDGGSFPVTNRAPRRRRDWAEEREWGSD
jgi:hypothetical protein